MSLREKQSLSLLHIPVYLFSFVGFFDGCFFFQFKYFLLIYIWLCWAFIAVPALPLVTASGGYSVVVVGGLLVALVKRGSGTCGLQ